MKKEINKEYKNKAESRSASRRGKSIETIKSDSEEKCRFILDTIEDGYYEIDLAGNFTFFNDTLCQMHGRSAEEMMGMNYRQYLDEENIKKVFPAYADAYKTGERFKIHGLQVKRKDGTGIYIDLSMSLRKDSTGTVAGYRGIVQNITELKQVEEHLKQREVQYRLLADHMTDQVWLMDLNFNLLYVSPSVEKLWGYKLEELKDISLNQLIEKLLMPESVSRAVSVASQVMPLTADTPDNVLGRTVELEFRCKDGRTVWEEIRCSLIRDENGKAVSILGEGRDITERKRVEDELIKGEKRYRSVFENAGLPMVIMEDSLLISMVNERFVEMSGYKKNKIEGAMNFTDFTSPEDLSDIINYLPRRKGDEPVEYECRIAHRSGEKFDVLIRIGRIPDAGQYIASFTDITARKQVEAALLESSENLVKENIRLRSSIRERYRFCDIIGKSESMQDVYEFILRAAATQANVIIYGESGTGKELVAKAIHETSDRSKKGFVIVHCGAIPETLMESEFFGYKKGAFTGANVDKRGYLDEADGGTLFLDEVGEIDRNMQVKLLRAISGDGYTPVGSNITKKADVRIISATNRNLRDLVKRGVMREDFFYRIHILPVYLPPLRDRKDDLPLLVDHFLQLYDKNHSPLPGNVTEALINYNWPGNVRELQNVLHRYTTLKKLDFTDLRSVLETDNSIEEVSAVTNINGNETHQVWENGKINNGESSLAMKDFERDHILKALSENHWHRSRTADALGIDRKTLFRKMKKFDLIES